MFLLSALRIAFAALWRHRLRSALTILGITIGIAAVICVVALGQGSTEQVLRQIESLGDTFIWIQAGSVNVGGARSGWGGARSLNAEDMQAIVTTIPEVKECSPQLTGREQVIAGGQNWNTRYTGVSPAYTSIRHWQMLYGGNIVDYDVQTDAKVMVIGWAVSQNLFGDDNPVGQTVRMGAFPYRIIGVLAPRGATAAGTNQDDMLLVPYTTAQKKLRGVDWVDDIMCAPVNADAIPVAEARITNLLRARHNIPLDGDDDFDIRDPTARLEMRAETLETMTWMLSAIASVSLLVGGVGIMNIMLVSVAERTHEIGLRLAIGARVNDIRSQFITEAVVLGIGGGIAGVAVGFLAAVIMTNLYGWPMFVSPGSVAIAVGCAVGAGLVFGYYPAQHAAEMDPIEALRID